MSASSGQVTPHFLLSANHMRNSNAQDLSLPHSSSSSSLNNHNKESLLTEIAKAVAPELPGSLRNQKLKNESHKVSFSVNTSLIQSSGADNDELSGLGVDAYSQKDFENQAIEQFEKQIKVQDFINSKAELEKIEKRIVTQKKQIDDVINLMKKANQSALFEVQKKRNDLITKQAKLELSLEELNKEAEKLRKDIDSFSDTSTQNKLKTEETERERLIRIGEITPFEAASNANLKDNEKKGYNDRVSQQKLQQIVGKLKHEEFTEAVERKNADVKRKTKSAIEGSGSEFEEDSEYETDEELGYLSTDDESGTVRRVGDWNDSDYASRVADAKFDASNRENFEEVNGLRVPKFIYDQLFKYQKTGLRWLVNLHTNGTGGILGDEMGLGKTVQIISFLAGLKYSSITDYSVWSYKGLGPTIIVCPATLVKQWVAELNRWWPPFRVAALTSDSDNSSQSKVVSKIANSNGILVCSYSIVRNLEQIIVNKNWHYVILDEGHQIRNPDAKITLTCKNFRTNHRIILSGSPIQNNLKELWSIFDFVYPGKLGTLPAFQEHFAVPITQGGYTNANHVQVQTAYKCACVLRDTISPYLLRRVKDDVKSSLTLPKKSEQILFCKLADDQRILYKNYIDKLDLRNIGQRRELLFSSLTNLRKICNHPSIFEAIGKEISQSEIGEDGHWRESGKMVVVESLLRLWKRQSHRVLIFTQSVQMLKVFEQFLIHFDYRFLKMEGKTSVASRQPMIQQFNSDPSIFVFLLTTKTGGLGVNLVGANRVLIYDPDWNPGTDMQARERAWRIGQNRDVLIYRLVCTGTIEEKIYHRQIFKLFLTNRILKDPKQRRFFKSHDLYDLFTLGDDESNQKGTETSSIFAGIGADVGVALTEKESQGPSDKNRQAKYTKPMPLRLSKSKEHIKTESSVNNGNEYRNVPENPSRSVNLKKCHSAPSLTKSNSSEKIKRVDSTPSSKKKLNKREKRALKSAIKQMLSKWGVSTESEVGKSMIRKLKKSDTLRCAVSGGGKIDGAKINGLDKVRTMKRKHKETGDCEDDRTKDGDEDDSDYILGKLFKGGGLQGAIQHDVIEDKSQGPDYWLVEKEAEKVAQEAVAKLKFSQEHCQSAMDGIPNWTGRSGFMNKGSKKFGTKSNLSIGSSSAGTSSSQSSESNFKPLSSAEMLKKLKQKKLQAASAKVSSNPFSNDDATTDDPTVHSAVMDEKFLEDLVTFIKYHSENPGEATSDELIGQFKKQLGEGNNALFKAMLSEVCNKAQSFSGAVVWSLKPDFARRLTQN